MFEDAIAEAVPADVCGRSAAGKRRGGPEVASLFVPEVEGLSARVAHRVVVPRGEAELVSVFAPGIGLAALRDDGAEVGIGQDVHPRCRRHLPMRGGDDVLAPIGGKSPQPVEEREIVAWQRSGWFGFWTAGSNWRQPRYGAFRMTATGHLVFQRSSSVAHDRARD